MRSKITLKELAKLLNVSVSTVSKSLNDSPEISPQTILRVKELAKLHNYKPNPIAVNLKKSRTGNIAVIVPNISNTFFAKVLGGVETEARNQGLQVITYISNESLKLEQQLVELISNGIVDGLLISVSEETQSKNDYSHLKSLRDYGIPVVLFDRINSGKDFDRVGVNDKGSIYDAVKYLNAKGFKKIGLVSTLGDLGIGNERVDGFKEACKSFGLNTTNENLIVSQDTETLSEKLSVLLQKNKLEALIGLDYLSTLLASRVAQENGLKIPKDIKIIGYVNEDFAPHLMPSISYIDQFPEKIGSIASQMLSDKIKDPSSKSVNKEILDTRIVHLDSTKV